MSKITDYIRVTTGTKGITYKVSDDGLFFISGNSTIKPTRDCTVLYIVVGGGANGNAGSGDTALGRGGGGGAVQTGRVSLIKDVEYNIVVNPTTSAGDGGTAVFEESVATKTVNITANGGIKASGAGGTAGSSTGSTDNVPKADGTSPSTAEKNGYGGIATSIGINGALPGKATDKNGQNGGLGGGGGGGYGSAGKGGNGGLGTVILLNINNTNLVQHVEKQLREMNHLPGTLIDQYNERYNATMMAGALWTVLATSLAFYVFTQV